MNQKAYFIEPIRVRPQISEGEFIKRGFQFPLPHTLRSPNVLPQLPRAVPPVMLLKTWRVLVRTERGAKFVAVRAFEICLGVRKGFVELGVVMNNK